MCSAVSVSSSLTFLNGAYVAIPLVLIAAHRLFNVLSVFVASIISFNVMAREQRIWLQS